MSPAPAASVEHLLSPGGCVALRVSQQHLSWEDRPEQRGLARAVEDVLQRGGSALLEAGTGVGKSFAYLVPALVWAAREKRCVAVSTSTIALQEQLMNRDLPLLQAALPFRVQTALVKGRGNFLCRRRLERALAEENLFESEPARGQLVALRAWAESGGEGSRQALPFLPESGVWESVRAEAGNCLQRESPFFGSCSWQRARQAMHDAHLLVMNHAVLLSDAAMRRTGPGFLPDISVCIVDEAHDLADMAASHLGERISTFGLRLLLGRLWSPEGRGLLATRGAWATELRRQVEAARELAMRTFDALEATRRAGSAGDLLLPSGAVLDEALAVALERLALSLEESAGQVADREGALEVGARARSVRAEALGWRRISRGEDPDCVRWIEPQGRMGGALCQAPLETGPLLNACLWSRLHAAVLTSATLCVGRPPRFDFMRRNLGLDDPRQEAFGSPFDHARQVRLRIRADLPDPTRAPQAWEEALPAAVLDAVRATRGGALVLFTSARTMQNVAGAVREEVARAGLTLLVQNEGQERSTLLEAFRASKAGVLFGVASFWQGVDVPGAALRHLIITRLPFEVPTHPLARARQDHIEKRGGDPFLEWTLPRAALKLRQGFGRLIRTATDQGQVTLLDPRSLTRPYGRFLLESLPPCPVESI